MNPTFHFITFHGDSCYINYRLITFSKMWYVWSLYE